MITRKKFFISAIIFFFFSFVILYFSSGAVQTIRDNLYNSDILFPFSLYRSFFQPGSHVDWVFGSNTPYLDLLFGLILWLLSWGNVHLTFAFYAVLQPIFLVVCLIYLAHSLLGKNWLFYFLVVVFSSLPIIVFSIGLTRSLFFLFAWYVHISTLALAAMALGLAIQVINQDRILSEVIRIKLYLLCLLTTLATTSDALFIFQFTAPFIGVLVFSVILSIISIKKAGLIILSLGVGTLLGQLLYKLPLLLGANRISLTGSFTRATLPNLIEEFHIILAKLSGVWGSSIWGWIIWSCFYLVCLAISILIVRRKIKGNIGKIRSRFFIILIFFPLQLLFNLTSTLFSGNLELRYFMPVVYIPLFLGWPFLIILIPDVIKVLRGKKGINIGIALIGIAVVILGVIFISDHDTHPDLAHYYPGLVACVDDHSRDLGLHRGAAQYWYARYISVLSKDNVEVAQETHAMAPFLILSNSDWYEDDFDFVLAYQEGVSENSADPRNLVNRDLVVAQFGEPEVSFNCGGIDMMVYNRETDQPFKRQFRLYMGYGNWK